jgi:hypothetical protein
MAPDGTRVCFEDLALARGYAQPAEVRYVVDIEDGMGNRLASFEQEANGPSACVSIGDTSTHATGYRIVSIRSRFIGPAGREGNHVAKAARLHLRWHEDDGRFVLVGLERDE